MKLGLCLCLLAVARSEVVENKVGASWQLNDRDVSSAFVDSTSRRELTDVYEDPYLRGSFNGVSKGPAGKTLAEIPDGTSLVPKVVTGRKGTPESAAFGTRQPISLTGFASNEPTPAPVAINFSTRSATVPKVFHPLAAKEAAEKEVVKVSEPLNVPSIKWEVYVDPVLLKAHTSFRLDEKEVEIFEVVSQLLTPYLQRLMGEPLLAYKLEVAYGESHPGEKDSAIIVTHFEVKVILEYLSDSIESHRKPVQEVASDYLHRFFEGSERYQLMGDLRRADIDVNEIVLEEEGFRSPVFDPDIIIQVQGPGSSNNPSSSDNEKDKTGMFAAIGAGSFVLVAIMYVAHRSKQRERYVTKLRLGESYSDSESNSSNRSAIAELQVVSNEPEAQRKRFSGGFGRFFKKTDDESKVSSNNPFDEPEAKRQRFSVGFGGLFRKGNDENEVSSRNSSRNSSTDPYVVSDEPEEKRQRFSGNFKNFWRRGNDEPEASDEPKTRERSYSGSFRRYPAGGIRPAAIQKEPAFSEHILKLYSVASGLAPPSVEDASVPPPIAVDDQSYSVAGDYSIQTDYVVKASPAAYGGGRYSNTVRAPELQDEEFSMPDEYSVAPSMMTDVFSIPSQSIMGKRPKSKSKSKDTLASPPSRQGVPNSDYPLLRLDGLDPVESPMSDVLMDEWSVDSFTTHQTTSTPRRNDTSSSKAGWTKPKKGSARKQQKDRRAVSDLNMPALS